MEVEQTIFVAFKESHPPSLHCTLTLNSCSSFATFRAPENPSFAHADLSANMVVERSVANNLVCERAREADTFIWDEISMTSRRVFELANKIHKLLSSHGESKVSLRRKTSDFSS